MFAFSSLALAAFQFESPHVGCYERREGTVRAASAGEHGRARTELARGTGPANGAGHRVTRRLALRSAARARRARKAMIVTASWAASGNETPSRAGPIADRLNGGGDGLADGGGHGLNGLGNALVRLRSCDGGDDLTEGVFAAARLPASDIAGRCRGSAGGTADRIALLLNVQALSVGTSRCSAAGNGLVAAVWLRRDSSRHWCCAGGW